MLARAVLALHEENLRVQQDTEAARRLLVDPPVHHEVLAIEERTASAIAAWLWRFANKRESKWLADQIEAGAWRKP